MKKVLVVDDEEDIIWTLKNNLKDKTLNIEVYTAKSGEEAIYALKTRQIDLIITDIRMPGISGLDLLVEAKRMNPYVDVIVMTAYPTSEFKKEATMRGGLRFIEKPFDINELRKIIRQLTESDRGFKGNLSGMELTDIIQLNCLSRATVSLKVKAADKEGVVFFKDGAIVHAVSRRLEGEEAFYEILKLESGTLESKLGAIPPHASIDKSFEALLMEGLRRIDEEKKENNLKTKTPVVKDIKAEEEEMAKLKDMLNDFTNITGVSAVCLVSRDGFMLDSSTRSGIDAEMVSAIAASGFGTSESMGKQLDKGSLTMTMFEYENGPVIFSPVGGEAFIVVIAEKDCNLGLVRVKIKKFSPELAIAAAI